MLKYVFFKKNSNRTKSENFFFYLRMRDNFFCAVITRRASRGKRKQIVYLFRTRMCCTARFGRASTCTGTYGCKHRPGGKIEFSFNVSVMRLGSRAVFNVTSWREFGGARRVQKSAVATPYTYIGLGRRETWEGGRRLRVNYVFRLRWPFRPLPCGRTRCSPSPTDSRGRVSFIGGVRQDARRFRRRRRADTSAESGTDTRILCTIDSAYAWARAGGRAFIDKRERSPRRAR